jgi:hypothetical protein
MAFLCGPGVVSGALEDALYPTDLVTGVIVPGHEESALRDAGDASLLANGLWPGCGGVNRTGRRVALVAVQ